MRLSTTLLLLAALAAGPESSTGGAQSNGCRIRVARHRLARNPTGGPGGLEIEAAGEAVNVQQFAGK